MGVGVSVDICAKSSRKVACFNHNASNKSNLPGSPSSTPFKLLGCKITGEKAFIVQKLGGRHVRHEYWVWRHLVGKYWHAGSLEKRVDLEIHAMG